MDNTESKNADSTEAGSQHSNESAGEHEEPLITAPLPARILAAAIDYLVVSALLFGSMHLVSYSDWQFLIPLFCGVLYFGAGNSEVTGGQTLGKKAFGLRVISACEEKRSDFSNIYLSLSQSILRYFLSFGSLVLLAEIPPLLYRASASQLPSSVLEAHMFVAMAYFIANAGFAVAHPLHKAIHDVFTPSLVVRGQPRENHALLLSGISTKMSFIRGAIPIALAVLLAFGLWRIGGVHSPASASVNELRYQIESRFPFRLLSVTESKDGIEIQGLVFENDKDAAEALTLKVGDFLSSRLTLPPDFFGEDRAKQLVFSVFSPDDPSMSQQKILYPLNE